MPKVHPYPPEFRREAVRLVKERGSSYKEASEGLGIAEQTLRNWVRQHEVDSGQREGLTTRERAELKRLRRENAILREEREILKRAAGGFNQSMQHHRAVSLPV